MGVVGCISMIQSLQRSTTSGVMSECTTIVAMNEIVELPWTAPWVFRLDWIKQWGIQQLVHGVWDNGQSVVNIL